MYQTTNDKPVSHLTSKTGRKLRLNTPEQNQAITQSALADEDALPCTDDMLKTVKVGRPRLAESEKKQAVSIRLSPEVMHFFKANGKGWQSRIDDALKEYIASH